MAGRQKTFPCGHIGKGQFCHRCKDEAIQAQKTLEAKQDWEARLSAASVSLDGLPKSVAVKALEIVKALNNRQSYLEFKGKRLVTMGQRAIISIPIGRHYRLICKEQGNCMEYIEVITHETYNNRLSSGGWSA